MGPSEFATFPRRSTSGHNQRTPNRRGNQTHRLNLDEFVIRPLRFASATVRPQAVQLRSFAFFVSPLLDFIPSGSPYRVSLTPCDSVVIAARARQRVRRATECRARGSHQISALRIESPQNAKSASEPPAVCPVGAASRCSSPATVITACVCRRVAGAATRQVPRVSIVPTSPFPAVTAKATP